MDTLRHPVQVWPGFDKTLNFLPSANKVRAAQVQLLFVSNFWQCSSFRNRVWEPIAQQRQGTESLIGSSDQTASEGLLLLTTTWILMKQLNLKNTLKSTLWILNRSHSWRGAVTQHTKETWVLFINSHVCYQSFLTPLLGQGQRRQNNPTYELIDRCNFNLKSWKAECDNKRSDPIDKSDKRWQWMCHASKGKAITLLSCPLCT